MSTINAHVALQQRVLPEYRAPFLTLLGKACTGGLDVFAGLPRTQEAIATVSQLTDARFIRARNMHLFSGKTYFCIQQGFLHWLEHSKPQILIVEANPRYLSTPAAIQWMHRRKLPVIGWGLGAPKAGAYRNRYSPPISEFVGRHYRLFTNWRPTIHRLQGLTLNGCSLRRMQYHLAPRLPRLCARLFFATENPRCSLWAGCRSANAWIFCCKPAVLSHL